VTTVFGFCLVLGELDIFDAMACSDDYYVRVYVLTDSGAMMARGRMELLLWSQ